MVVGIKKFKAYFQDFTDNYVIIGGTACDIIIEEAGFTPRATKDIDIIIIVEALTSDFIKKFWEFIADANYKHQEKSPDDRKYYRFRNPKNKNFPIQIELFSKEPELLNLNEGSHLTPIPIDEDLSSLSAILMNDDYYDYTLAHSFIEDGVNIANNEALICLKAKAFLDMTIRKQKGEHIDERNIRKHKTDIFRLAVFLTEHDKFVLPHSIHSDLMKVTDIFRDNLPDKNIFKSMGMGAINTKIVLEKLISSFNLKNK